jgi:copper chaperone
MSNERATILEVQGMTCPSCVRHINAALGEIAGVANVDVQLRDGLVVVKHDPTQAPIAQLIATLGDEGYVSKQRTL